jgi:hypothetical protein
MDLSRHLRIDFWLNIDVGTVLKFEQALTMSMDKQAKQLVFG